MIYLSKKELAEQIALFKDVFDNNSATGLWFSIEANDETFTFRSSEDINNKIKQLLEEKDEAKS